jgi:hypothetical protein
MPPPLNFAGKVVTVGGTSWTVPHRVHDARRIGNHIIVLYDYTCGPPSGVFRNLEAFDEAGHKLWTAENPTNADPVDAYVEFVSDAPLVVWNFACYACTIDPTTGRLLKAVFTK